MPNWCENELIITGPSAALDEILEGLVVQDLEYPIGYYTDFNFIVPCPETLREVTSGSDEIVHDILYGDWTSVASYKWMLQEGDIPCSSRAETWAKFLKSKVDALEKARKSLREESDPNKRDSLRRYITELEQVDYKAKADMYEYNVQTYGCRTWYEFCLKHWGTKWQGTYLSHKRTSARRVVLSFDTAWTPPKPVVLAASKKFPECKFNLKYYEGGCAFKGQYKVSDGCVEKDETSGYTGPRGG